MNFQARPTLTPAAEKTLEDLAEELEIPQSRYAQAEARYQSLGRWLNRENSSIRQYEPQVHVQGSFGLGTVIPPVSDEEHYDIDAVCEFRKLTKSELSQHELKKLLGDEIKLYASSQNMTNPVEERRRCWMLVYAEGAQFHMDVTRHPNATEQAELLENRGLDRSLADTAIAITDIDHPFYRVISSDWQRSNPRGYLKWFHGRMAKIFEERKNALRQKGIQAGTESIPDYKVRTPLQSAIMILKRHRDIAFKDRCTDRPISVILTTLAGHAYNGENKIGHALFAILNQMNQFIVCQADGTYLIANPSDPSENFADKWKKHPERADAFFEWLALAQNDFARAATLSNEQLIADDLAKGIGAGVAERVKKRAANQIGAPAILSSGLLLSEAQANKSAVDLRGDRRNA